MKRNHVDFVTAFCIGGSLAGSFCYGISINTGIQVHNAFAGWYFIAVGIIGTLLFFRSLIR